MILRINTNELVKLTNKLEKLHRSALPVAVREALTMAAKDVKTNTMPKSAKRFKQRKPNFFKANSRYERATGFDISKMKATVGFVSSGLQNSATNYAVRDLQQQEHGGKIGGRDFIAMRSARNGRGNVRENFRLHELNKSKIVRAGGGRSKKQNFIRAAFVAAKTGKALLGNKDSKGSRTLSMINEIWGSTRRSELRSSRRLMIKRTPLYRVKGNRVVIVKRTDFMKRASNESALNLNAYYIQQAQKQLAKYMNK